MKMPRAHQARRGMALIIALCALVLASALVLLFLSRSLLNRQIAFSSSNQIKADILARSSGDMIVSEIRNEIVDPTHSTPLTGGSASYPTFYQPKTTADAVPRLLGVASATGPVICVSASGVPIQPNGTITGSSVSIDTPSINGRYISSSHWFTSTNGSPEVGSQSTMPTWLFVTRSDGITTPTFANARNTTSSDYVIGRFAYTVYDLGGLPNVNVAGSAPVDQADVPFKSSPAYADLTAFGLNSAAVTNLVAWRNSATAVDAPTFREWATAVPRTSGTINAAALSAAFSGHLSAATGDNAVLTRHDLLQNTNFPATSGDFTHFSRSANYPSYSPATPTTTNPNLADVRFANAGTITHYRDDGTPITYTVAAGDPLLQHRFSLAKLAWLTYKGPSADLATTDSLYNAGGSDANIAACFGLTWDSTNLQWNYTAEDSTSYSIKTLSAVAGESREPNFFEMLKAGIADGSIGQSAPNGTLNNYASEQILEANSDLQILRIGADIIDCADTDNYPTTITLNVGGVATPVYGQEDLPSLYRMIMGEVSSVTFISDTLGTTTSQLDWATLYVTPQIFNPNRSGITPSATPPNIRISVVNGGVDRVFNERAPLGSGSVPLAEWNLNLSLTGDPPIVIPSSSYETFRSTIKIPNGTTDATSATTLSSLITSPCQIDSTIGAEHGFIYYVYSPGQTFTNKDGTFGSPSIGSMITFRSYANNLIFDMEYQDSAGGWHTYDTFTGNKAFGTASGLGNHTAGIDLEFLPPVYTSTPSPVVTSAPDSLDYCQKIDPRTTRFGISGGQYYYNSKNVNWIYSASTVGHSRGVKSALPFGSGSPGSGQSFFPETWVQGGKSASSDWNDSTLSTTTNVHDKDGVLRPADEWLSPSSNANNLFANLTVANGSNRPVILQRPFRSVAELGYVFRDSPWKTLNFFDETSGDAALLDLFAVSDEPTVSQGRVNLEGSNAILQQSLLSGVAQSYDGTGTLSSPSSIATAFNSYAFSSGTPTTNMPVNVAGLAAFMDSTLLTNSYTPAAVPDKTRRESVVRALAGNTQTRTWNLLIDVVAQTGRYPSTAGSLNDFLVDGEKRYWLFVAIDRYTGKIIDRQLEPVDE